jgi:hypothetical protein
MPPDADTPQVPKLCHRTHPQPEGGGTVTPVRRATYVSLCCDARLWSQGTWRQQSRTRCTWTSNWKSQRPSSHPPGLLSCRSLPKCLSEGITILIEGYLRRTQDDRNSKPITNGASLQCKPLFHPRNGQTTVPYQPITTPYVLDIVENHHFLLPDWLTITLSSDFFPVLIDTCPRLQNSYDAPTSQANGLNRIQACIDHILWKFGCPTSKPSTSAISNWTKPLQKPYQNPQAFAFGTATRGLLRQLVRRMRNACKLR